MPTLPASDGKDYNFPEGTTAETALGFLKSKGLSVRSGVAAAKPTSVPFSEPENPMMGVPATSIPVAGLGTGIGTLQTAKDVQTGAKKGEEALRKGTSLAAGTAAFVGLAPLAAGAGLAGGLGYGALAGLTSGTARQGVEYVLGGEKKSLKDLSIETGVDTVLGALGEGTVRTGTAMLRLGGEKVLLPLVARTAAKADQGLRTLQDYGTKLMNGIRLVTKGAGEPKMSTREMLGELDNRLSVIRTGPSDAFAERWPGLLTKIHAAQGDLASMVEIKGELSQWAYKGKGLKFEEESALKWLSEELDRKIGVTMKQIGGGDAQSLYNGLKENWAQTKRFSGGLQLTSEVLKRMFARSIPAAIGAGAGYYEGKQYGPAGGVIGAAVGATTADAMAQRVAPWVLERMLTDKAAGPIARQAMNKMAQGELKEAEGLFKRAMIQSGVQEILRPIAKDQLQLATPTE